METSKGDTRSKVVFAFLVAGIVVVAGIVAASYHSPSTTQSSTSTTGTMTTSSHSASSGTGATQTTFLYGTIPREFAAGGYALYTIANGEGYTTTVNGTIMVNLGFTVGFNVSNGSTNQTAAFGWVAFPLTGVLPVPNYATLFGGRLILEWFTNSTGDYLSLNQAPSTDEAMCAGRYETYSSPQTPLLLTDPSSTITICVEYVNNFNPDFSEPTYASVYTWTSSGPLKPALGVNITAYPAAVNLTEGQGTQVTYTIQTGPGSTGFYRVSLLQICQPLPLAVGYPASAVNSSDFPGLHGGYNCPAQLVSWVISGYNETSTAG